MLCVHKLHLPGRSRSALYNRFTIPRPLTSVLHTVDNNLKPTAFSYTCCTEQYSSLKYYPNSEFRLCVHKLYLPGTSRSVLYNRCTTPRPLTSVHHTEDNNLKPTAFLNTCCTDHYSSPKYYPNSTLRLCVHKLYLIGTSHSALYNRCTTARPLTSVHHTVDNNLKPTAFSYTCCTDQYSSPKYYLNSALRLCVHILCLPGRSRSVL